MPDTWCTAREAVLLCFSRRTLRPTVKIALVVGTVLTAINQGEVIAGGEATVVTWLRTGANYLVPFIVSSTGFLSATRVRVEPPTHS